MTFRQPGVDARRRVLILTNYPTGAAASQRFRFEQYLGILRDAGIEVTVAPFFADWVWPILYKPGRTLRKMWGVFSGFVRRLALLLRAGHYDYIFIHLEAAPLGPPIVEWCLFAFGCKVVYDIDDAIFISRTSKANWLAAPLRWRSKIPYVTRKSWRVTACNPFLVDWAAQHNPHSTLLPTTIDQNYHRRTRRRAPAARPVIGWTGSRSNIPYLDLVFPALLELQHTHDFAFKVICDVSVPNPGLHHFESIPWRRKTEIQDLETLDIGVMPVPDSLWEKGKVGFKAIQYGALETVSVASDVGSGAEVIVDGKTGFLVKNEQAEWYRALAWLLDHPETWDAFGRASREHILARYSVQSQANTYIKLFE